MLKAIPYCRRVNRFAACTLFVAWLFAPSLLMRAQEKQSESDDDNLTVLISMRMIEQIDDVCGFFSKDDRLLFDKLFEVRLKSSGVSEETKKKILGTDDGFKPDCKSKDSKAFFNMGRDLVESVKKEARGKRSDHSNTKDSCESQLGEVKTRLDKYFSETGSGLVKGFDGCWDGRVDDHWKIDVCFTSGGAKAKVLFQRDGPSKSCEFVGEARAREGGIYFAGYDKGRSCSDGKRAEHVEGTCSEVVNGKTKCVVSAYSCGNEILELEKGVFGNMNSELAFKK